MTFGKFKNTFFIEQPKKFNVYYARNSLPFCIDDQTKVAFYYVGAATGGALYEKVFLKISQNSQENIYVRVSIFIKFTKIETLARVFSCEVCEISKNTFFTEHVWATASNYVNISAWCSVRVSFWING